MATDCPSEVPFAESYAATYLKQPQPMPVRVSILQMVICAIFCSESASGHGRVSMIEGR